MEKMEVLLETSARHIHVTQEALETLFGKGHELTKKKDLSQPGQFACEDRVTITGPEGEIEISEGVIVAKRHIHLVPETAEKWGVKNKDVVSVKVNSDGRSAVLGDVVIRVSENFADAMHIDTDESNAVMAAPGMMVEVIK